MKLGIMQPYFFPYIGYWQLMNAVDKYIVYDNIKYTKKGWINRNRILSNDKDVYISLPLKNDSDYLNVCERQLSGVFNRNKLLRQIQECYRKAPFFNDTFLLIQNIILFESNNLFEYLYNSIKLICSYLEIKAELIQSSSIEIDHSLKNSEKVLSFCERLNASDYYNAIGGKELYDKEIFIRKGVHLSFLQSRDLVYRQFGNSFIPNLSIIDVLMFNSLDNVKKMLDEFDLK